MEIRFDYKSLSINGSAMLRFTIVYTAIIIVAICFYQSLYKCIQGNVTYIQIFIHILSIFLFTMYRTLCGRSSLEFVVH